MKTTKTLIALALISSLVACGGSDNNNSTQGSGSSSAALAKFTTMTSVTNSCGEATRPAFDVVFHKLDGAVNGTTKSDNQGKIDTDIPQGTQHISVIIPMKNNDGEKVTYVDTYLDVSNGLTLDRLSFYNSDDSCSCTYEAQVDISELKISAPDAILEGVNRRPIHIDVADDVLPMCSKDKLAYLSIKTPYFGGSKAAKFDLSSGAISVKESDFIHQGVKVDYSHIDEHSMGTVNIRGAIDNRSVFHQVSYRTKDNLYIYPSIADTNLLSLASFEENSFAEGNFKSFNTAYQHIDENGHLDQPQKISAYDVGYEFSNSFVNALVSSNSNVLSYDYTNAVPSADRVQYMIGFNDYKHGAVSWYINSEAKGTIPDLEFGDILTDETMDESSMYLSFNLYDYNHEGNYIDLINVFQRQTYEQLIDSGIYDGGASIRIEFELNSN
ncbi:hypothetical protein HUZ36_18355 [Pseudoalteromonas sp. McH1-7]|uniref:Lipoprotein n=1 Tax=Pseudoalteromonas peptidolytica F12-50-A1 TaxID=1315280 RepID=A0A8I0T5W0_9GAMM|nr:MULTISPECIES: hypothetical protein [Pseudoalteromonas]MBE0346594.1 hypothetical protein [Pseudoalteromonas peptidolytica F12-50-A1]NLR15405.1 hypothetical protein [Pseudoalteromonas peptidolytica]NUZ12748.1 hypothetical protein [Pseudoalteromonas sp. McH1-7]GEK10066.1 hypothetical protein PPE03_23150 [Pseudoalteromonas peptidolytica]